MAPIGVPGSEIVINPALTRLLFGPLDRSMRPSIVPVLVTLLASPLVETLRALAPTWIVPALVRVSLLPKATVPLTSEPARSDKVLPAPPLKLIAVPPVPVIVPELVRKRLRKADAWIPVSPETVPELVILPPEFFRIPAPVVPVIVP